MAHKTVTALLADRFGRMPEEDCEQPVAHSMVNDCFRQERSLGQLASIDKLITRRTVESRPQMTSPHFETGPSQRARVRSGFGI